MCINLVTIMKKFNTTLIIFLFATLPITISVPLEADNDLAIFIAIL